MEENFKINKREGTTYEPLPADKYTVQLFSVKTNKRPTYDTRLKPADEQEIETVLDFQFVVLNSGEHRGRSLWANFVPTYLYVSKKNGKNMLYRILEAFIGKELTPEQEATLDFEKIKTLIGRQANVFTEIKTKGDKQYSNIINLTPCLDKLPELTAEEKEKAIVKPKEDRKQDTMPNNSEPTDDEIRVEDIPF